MVEKGEEANSIAKWRMFIRLKKWIFESWVLSFTSEKVFWEAKWLKHMPAMVLKIPWNFNQGKYDVKIDSNPLFDKLRQCFGVVRLMEGLEHNDELLLVDE